MHHPIHRVARFDIVGPDTLSVTFTEGTTQEIDFRPKLHGTPFGPLRELLHEWPRVCAEFAARAQTWSEQHDEERANTKWSRRAAELRTARGSFGTSRPPFPAMDVNSTFVSAVPRVGTTSNRDEIVVFWIVRDSACAECASNERRGVMSGGLIWRNHDRATSVRSAIGDAFRSPERRGSREEA